MSDLIQDTTREALAADLERLACAIEPPQLYVSAETRALAAEVMRSARAALADAPAVLVQPAESLYGRVSKWLDANCRRVAWNIESATFEVTDDQAFEMVSQLAATPAAVQRAQKQTPSEEGACVDQCGDRQSGETEPHSTGVGGSTPPLMVPPVPAKLLALASDVAVKYHDYMTLRRGNWMANGTVQARKVWRKAVEALEAAVGSASTEDAANLEATPRIAGYYPPNKEPVEAVQPLPYEPSTVERLLRECVQMVEDQDMLAWSDAHDYVMLDALRAALAEYEPAPQAPAVPPESLQDGIPQKPVGKFIFRDGHWQQVYLSNPEGQLLYACPVIGSASTSEPAQAVTDVDPDAALHACTMLEIYLRDQSNPYPVGAVKVIRNYIGRTCGVRGPEHG